MKWDVSMLRTVVGTIPINDYFNLPYFGVNTMKIRVKPKEEGFKLLNYAPVNRAYFYTEQEFEHDSIKSYSFFLPSIYKEYDNIPFTFKVVKKGQVEEITKLKTNDLNQDFELLLEYNNKNNLRVEEAKVSILGKTVDINIEEGKNSLRVPLEKVTFTAQLMDEGCLEFDLKGNYLALTGHNRSPFNQLNKAEFVTYKDRESFGKASILPPLEGSTGNNMADAMKKHVYPFGEDSDKTLTYDADYNYISTNRIEYIPFEESACLIIGLEKSPVKSKPFRPIGGLILTEPARDEDNDRKCENHIQYIQGYPDHSVRPDGQITRAETATMMARLLELDLSNIEAPNYNDMDNPDAWYNKYINTITKRGLMEGYPDGSFQPNKDISRAEFAQLISSIDKKNTDKAPFGDVENHWAQRAIDQAYGNDRIDGYPDGTYKPNQSITRAEAAKILNRLFDRMVQERGIQGVKEDINRFTDLKVSHWGYYEMVEATNRHCYTRYKDGDYKELEEKWHKVNQRTWDDIHHKIKAK